MADVVLDMSDERPIWRRPAWVADEVRAALPSGWTLAVMDTPTAGTGDGATRADPAVLEAVADARAYLGFGIAAAVIEAGPALEWVHTGTAGVGSSLTPALRARRPIFTNSAGIHAPPMAEAVLGMILHFTRGFDLALRGQARGEWDPGVFYEADAPLIELGDATVGVVGLGGIGRAVASLVRTMGARVLGLRRSGRDGPMGVEVVVGDEGLDRLLANSDVVVVTAPETDATRGLLDAAAFARMKPGVVIVNVARGSIIDEPALIEALRSGRVRGAGLDVTATEPLPPDSPLWAMDQVLITPHVSGVSRTFWRRQTNLMIHNLHCLIEERPEEMRNQVDLEAGY